MKSTAVIILITVLICTWVYGQSDHYEYYRNNALSDEEEGRIISDEDLFYLPVLGDKDIFTRMSEFNFSSVRYMRRGYPDAFNRTYLNNIDVYTGLASSPDYSLLTVLRRSGFNELIVSGLRIGNGITGYMNGFRKFSPEISTMPKSVRASVSALPRKALVGGSLSVAGKMAKEWAYTLTLKGKYGRDIYVDGAFSNETSFAAGIEKSFGKGHKLTFVSIGTAGENGLRGYTTREVYDLTGDNLYNPLWGKYNGKVRNSKVANRFQPLFLLSYEGRLSKSTRFDASASYRFGKNSYSAIMSYRADNPYPDYYRNLPSYAENSEAYNIIKTKWLDDKDTRRIDWGDLYDQNLNAKEHPAYVLEDRTEEVSDAQLALTAFTVLDKHAEISYGIRIKSAKTLFYKRIKDMLGGVPFEDMDQFLDDYPFNDVRHNNTRDPSRKIGKGDKFGYNYSVNGLDYEVFGTASYRKERFAIAGGLELGRVVYSRTGHYEKELFPGKASYGKSKRVDFHTCNFKAAASYYFSPLQSLSVSAMIASAAQSYGSVFLSPKYCNNVVEKPSPMSVHSLETQYRVLLGAVDLNVCGYYTATGDETSVYQYYDDISGKYSDMVLTGIDKRYYGVELGARYEISSRFSASAIAAAGNNTYTSHPNVDIFEDATQTKYVSGSKSYLKGYRLGGSPEITVSAELSYKARGWIASVTYSFMDGRYITPNPLWRMERAYGLAVAPERYREFVGQEKLAQVSVLRLFVLKSFYLKTGRLTATLSVDNLLGSKDIIYNGYEQMRVMQRGIGPARRYTPFDRKYLYSYGRTFYGSLSYMF